MLKYNFVVFEVLTAEVIKNSVFWGVIPCSSVCYLFAICLLLGLLFNPGDEGHMFLPNVGWFSADYTMLYPRKQNSSDNSFVNL
jgi:hypothetical protein